MIVRDLTPLPHVSTVPEHDIKRARHAQNENKTESVSLLRLAELLVHKARPIVRYDEAHHDRQPKA